MSGSRFLLWVVAGLGFVFLAGCPRLQPPPEPPVIERPPEAPPDTVELTLYFTTPDYEALVPEKRTVPASEATAKKALELLWQGPQGKDLVAAVPDTARVLGVKVEEGVAEVDLSEEFERDVGGSNYASLAVYALVNTLTQLPDVRSVQILVEGQKRSSFAGAMDLSEPLLPDRSFVGSP